MCGICGIVAFDGAASTDADRALGAMVTALAHRGPDDSGSYVSQDGLAVLGHTRLSIIDLSAAGHQPMASATGRYWITFNGEIYNYRELRDDLRKAGVRFRTETDTEVLLNLYEAHGAECVRLLRGMFAFAVWDSLERTCFLARDTFGIKPLYYYIDKGTLVFASELKALLASGLVPKRLNPTAVAGFFRTGSAPEPHTLVVGVRALKAGHALSLRAGHARECQHSPITFATKPASADADHVANTRAALLDSVEHHFLSDVPVGIFLSGGIDSTALLALASQQRRGDIRTFSLAFDEPGYDESSLASRTAEHFGTRHHEQRMGADLARGLFDEFFSRIDRPTIDGFNTFVVSKFAAEQGMKVVLSGVGGDELFGGYPSFRRIPDLLGLRRPGMKLLENLAGGVIERWAPRPTWRRLGQFLSGEASVRRAYQAYRSIFLTSEAERMALGYAGSLPAAWWEDEPVFPTQPTLGDELSALELGLYMRNQLLRDSDVMSMASGLELRVPFLDQQLLAQLSRVPAAVRLQPGKQLLIDAVPEVPEWISRQPKRGFVFPFAKWFGSEWQPMFLQSSLRFGVVAETWYQKWAVFVFERWCREVGVAWSSGNWASQL